MLSGRAPKGRPLFFWSGDMSFDTILVVTGGRVGLITLNRPQALNALNTQVLDELNQPFEQFENHPPIGSVELARSSKAFPAAADVTHMVTLRDHGVFMNHFFPPPDHIAIRRTPLIAAASGYALGGGCKLAMICEFIY